MLRSVTKNNLSGIVRMFGIAVRSYDRAAIFNTHTLKVIRAQGLTDALTVFVGSDIQPYRDMNPDLTYIQVPKGAHKATEGICAHYPRDFPIVFLDDDLKDYFECDPSGNAIPGDLRATIQRGFESGPIFSFSHSTNRYWMKQRPAVTNRYGIVPSYAFGALNRPELIVVPYSQGEEPYRTAQYLQRGIIPKMLQHAAFKITGWGKMSGGSQSSGDRTDTLGILTQAHSDVSGWTTAPYLHPKVNFYVIDLLPAATIKRKLRTLTTN
jgi:hypothetical protein